MGSLMVSREETSPSLAEMVASLEPHDLAPAREQTSPEGMITIVFTDIEGSTDMLERLGEPRWLDAIQRHNRIVRGCAAGHSGQVVKFSGDGFMLTFASARAALAFTVALQQLLVDHNRTHPDERLLVRVGVHTGQVFPADQDFMGRAVVLAARITGRARGGEILVSAASREYTHQAVPWRLARATELSLKGLAALERVYSLDWSR